LSPNPKTPSIAYIYKLVNLDNLIAN